MFQVPIQKPMESLQFMLGTYESSKKPLEKKYCKFNKGASMRSGVCDVTWPRSSVVPWRIVFCCGLTSRWKSCLDSRQSQLANWVFVDFTHLLGLPCRGDFHRRTFWDPKPSLQRLLLLVPTQQQVRGNRRERCNPQVWDRSHGPSPMAWRVGGWELQLPLQWTWLAGKSPKFS